MIAKLLLAFRHKLQRQRPVWARSRKPSIGASRHLNDKDHIVLNDNGFQLVVHGIPQAIAAHIDISAPPQIREDSVIKICLPVANIAAARLKAAELGGSIAPVSNEWAARGFRACDGYDPEGNVFQVRESAP